MALGSATGVLVRGDRDAGRRRPCDDGGGDVGDGAPHQKPEGCPCRFQREHGPDTGPSETEKFQLF